MALAIMAAGTALSMPAGAQFFEERYPSYQRGYRQRGGGFPFYGGGYNPYYRPSAPAESSRAPTPRKVETPPTSTVVVIGDSLADWLAYGLEETFADSPDIGVVRKVRANSGLVRYEPRSDTPEWSQAVKDILAQEKPNAIVVMLGLNDRTSLRDKAPPRPAPARNGEKPAAATTGQATQPAAQGQNAAPAAPAAAEPTRDEGEQPAAAAEAQRPGGSYEFHTDKWAELYSKRIDDMIAALKSKGAPVLWVGLPSIRGPRSTGDMSYLDELYRERAEKAGIVYVDIWDGFVDENGRYAVQGPDFEGQIRRLRSGDGVHFTKVGAVKLAHYVEHELRRVITSHITPVALPAPEEPSPAKPGNNGPAPRPVAGPVLPLTTTATGESGDLLGAGGRPAAPAAPDPVATRVLAHGDAVAAPSGRADDFAWPRRGGDANGAADAEPEPPAPAAPAKKGAGRNDTKKAGDAKTKAAPETPSARTRHAPRASLDGAAPRPPAPIGAH